MNAKTKISIKEYLDLPWSYTIEQEDGYYIVYVNEFAGICTDGESIEEAMINIKEALEAAIEIYIEQGKIIPVPVNKKKYKGNIAYRTSPERHFKIARIAQQKHISLSKIIDLIIDTGLDRLNPLQSNHRF